MLRRRVARAGMTLVLMSGTVYGETGSVACTACHREIYDSYQATGMARSSGSVASIDTEGSFEDKASDVKYRVFRQDGAVWFGFASAEFQGRRRLEYFVGSGTVGRSYLISRDGFLYQAPVSWYTAAARWDLSPGYQQYDQIYLTRPIGTECLECHASGLQQVAGTSNGFASPPFREGGISCERCHGPGDAHIAGHSKMVNPAGLPPDRRDSICAQCHLAGEARITRAQAPAFRPGDRLADSRVVFVWSESLVLNVASHFETLYESACKKAAGDRMWCGSCHDPHRAPAEAEKAAFYRARCLQCHQAAECSRGPNCAVCHMPKTAVRDVQHAAYTDHAIRKPGRPVHARAAAPRKLVPFGGAAAGERETGLAYASIPGFEKQARDHLERAPQDDAEVLARLAYLYESAGNPSKAAPLYAKALELDPSQVAAAVNLGNQYIKSGEPQQAIRLWQSALEKSPGLETVRFALAVALFRSGDSTGGAENLRKLLDLNPGNLAARKLLNEARSGH
jgi:predicted CXXCH cytochrome family protein